MLILRLILKKIINRIIIIIYNKEKIMNTYISENKFQFITDFSKHAYTDVKGNSHELNFNDLTIVERIMLSSYLTFLCSNNEGKKTNRKDLYNLIFNFNNKRQRKTSYQDPFIEDISNFIARQPYYFAFIKSHYNDIVNDKTFIYRQQLNHSEMDVLYLMKFRRNYHSLMNVLYIIGVAKQNIATTYLNKLPLSNISENITYSKKLVEEIFEKINSVSKNEVKYKIVDGIVYFGNGFGIEEDEEYQSNEKQLFNKTQKEESILDELAFDSNSSSVTHVVEKKIIPQTPVVEKVELEKYEEPKSIPFDLSEVKADVFVFQSLLDKLLENPNYCSDLLEKRFPECGKRSKFLRSVNKEIGDITNRISEDKDLIEFTTNPEYCFKNDKNWQEKKDIAKYNIIKLSKPMFKFIEKVHDEKPDMFELVLAGIFLTNRSYIDALIYSKR